MSIEKIISLCKRRGFIFPGSEIYGGLANTWDYGPYGIALKKTLKNIWWKHFVEQRDDIVGLDSSILMNPKVWEASGHIDNFTDPLIDCKNCKNRFRGDKLLEEKIGIEESSKIKLEQIASTLVEYKINCPECGKLNWSEAKQFNLMFKTHQGSVEGDSTEIYLRPETAQGIFVNFINIVNTYRIKIPFGIAQIGKAFRNEISPKNFIFRTREFEQMEIEYFFHSSKKNYIFSQWLVDILEFFANILGIKEKNLKVREHSNEELSHYSSWTSDIEYKFGFDSSNEWGELAGIADRGIFDLSQHEKFSGKDLHYYDQITKEKYVPHVIEPSFGCDRTVLAVLIDAYNEEKLPDGSDRIVMKFRPQLAPVQIAVFPLLKNKPELVEKARYIFDILKKNFRCEFDDNGNIGKRYRRQDEIGTPYCVTVDFNTLEKNIITVRDRDTMIQENLECSDTFYELKNYLNGKIGYYV